MERYYTKGCVVIDHEDDCIVRVFTDRWDALLFCRFMNYTWAHNT